MEIEIKEEGKPISTEELPEILTANDIASHLRVEPCTVYGLLKKNPEVGGIPSYRFGRNVRANRKDYLVWLEAQKVQFPSKKVVTK